MSVGAFTYTVTSMLQLNGKGLCYSYLSVSSILLLDFAQPPPHCAHKYTPFILSDLPSSHVSFMRKLTYPPAEGCDGVGGGGLPVPALHACLCGCVSNFGVYACVVCIHA